MQTSSSNGHVYAIRHAQSTYNDAYEIYEKEGGTDPNTQEEYIDTMLTAYGVIQCQMNKETVQRSLPKLSIIYVSPLRRALETAYQLFCDHPNRGNIRLILDPDLREMIYSPSGIAYPVQDVLN